MAKNSTRSTAASAKPAAKPTKVVTATETVNDKPERFVASQIDPETYVTVRNGFQGRLIYKSSRTGERFVWESFGDEQEMTLRELKNAKNSSKKFFTENWFMFDEDWIVDYIGAGQFYKHALSIDGFDEIFDKTPDKISEIVKDLSSGQKKAVGYRARQLINEGRIDSRKAIAALEDALGTTLIEK